MLLLDYIFYVVKYGIYSTVNLIYFSHMICVGMIESTIEAGPPPATVGVVTER